MTIRIEKLDYDHMPINVTDTVNAMADAIAAIIDSVSALSGEIRELKGKYENNDSDRRNQ